MTVTRVGGAGAAGGATGLNALLDKTFKQTDAYVAKLDGNKNGKLEEPEVQKFMKKLDRLNAKLDKTMEDTSSDVSPRDRSKFAQNLSSTRSKMTDAQRLDMLVASAVGQVTDGRDLDTLPIKDLQKGVRTVVTKMVEDLQNPKGGLEGALGAMFAGMLLPKDLFDFAIGQR
jgi:hypothetical protein